jgi:hypothetical protein
MAKQATGTPTTPAQPKPRYLKTVMIGGKEYSFQPLPVKQAQAWRELLKVPFTQINASLTQVDQVQLENVANVASVVEQFSGTLINSIGTVLDLLCAYAPEIRDDRERIENEAFDYEVVDAFAEVLKQIFPFGNLLRVFRG